MSVSARPVVLAPLALRATGTLNAGRGAKARRARRRVLRLRLVEQLAALARNRLTRWAAAATAPGTSLRGREVRVLLVCPHLVSCKACLQTSKMRLHRAKSTTTTAWIEASCVLASVILRSSACRRSRRCISLPKV